MQIYNNDADFALAARKIFALAFVPQDCLEAALDALSNNTPEDLQPILY